MHRADVLVVGAGSIGSRHAKNLADAGAAVAITDPDAAVGWDIEGVRRIPFSTDVPEGFDGVVVASPTVHHPKDASAALRTGARVLVEKPLAVSTASVADLVRAADDRLMVGYNMRCHPEVRRAVAMVKEGAVGDVVFARVWFGHYLPNWRRGKDYRYTYSARADLGGGILLDASHELDLLIWMFGKGFETKNAVVHHSGVLEIEAEDYVQATLRHDTGPVVELSLDYLSRRKRRGIEVIGTTNTLRLDWARAVLELENESRVEQVAEVRPVTDSYVFEAATFLEWVEGKTLPPVDAREGLLSLELAEQIRATAAISGAGQW